MQFNKNEALEKAQTLAHDFDENEAASFAKEHTDKAWYDDFVTLLDLIRDSEFAIDSKTYLMIAGALAYVILPFDIIPDFIPGIGFIDDIFVVGMVMKSLSDEVERYKAFKAQLSA